jgi:hypothetical protein
MTAPWKQATSSNLAVIGGDTRLGSTARVEGDVASVGGRLKVDEEAYVRGEIVETTEFDFGQISQPFFKGVPPSRPEFDQGARFEPFDLAFRIMAGFAQGLVLALVIAGIGLLVVLFLPTHTQTVAQTIRQVAPASFGVGLLTLIVGITAMILLFITCCLIPIGLLVALALVLATLYGWIVVGYLLGGRTLRAIQKDRGEPSPTVSALVGVFLVTLIQQGLMALSNIPCLGFFFWLMGAALWLVVASIGLGAVVLTRFGTQPYTGAVVLTRFGTQPYTGASRTGTPPPTLPPTAEEEPEQIETPGESESSLLEDPTGIEPEQD